MRNLADRLPVNAGWWALRGAPALLAGGALIWWLLSAQAPAAPAGSAPVAATQQRAAGRPAQATLIVAQLTNQERRRHGCPDLAYDDRLAQAAQAHSEAMARDDFFAHDGADGSTMASRIRNTGYRYQRIAENIAAGAATPAEVVAGWMASPGHRANILDCALREIGVGFYEQSPDGGEHRYHFYWTQNFGSPQ